MCWPNDGPSLCWYPKMRSLTTSIAALALVTAPTIAVPATSNADPCAKFAGQAFVVPADALACLKSFPFNETLRQNVLGNIARVFDFFTFFPMSIITPTSLPMALCRCMTKLREGPATGASSPSAWGRTCFFGLSVTEIVVPNRECRVGAPRLKSRRRFSSMFNNC